MITITEAKLTFSFPDAWKVSKYDDSKFFRNHVEKCQGSKAVDILALSAEMGLFLIEIKDFRGHRIENKQRLKSGDLLIEVMQKVRDNFTVFSEAKFEFSPGLNVIIGDNGTGKSHLLYLSFLLCKEWGGKFLVLYKVLFY